jgi:uncharacterized protein (DUF924 family)
LTGITPADVVSLWREAGPDRWWAKDADFDRAIREKFMAVYEAAARGELSAWEETEEGALALVIVLDQFPRNMFRGTARAFASDALARSVADHALRRGFDVAVAPLVRPFFYLPFMHSERLDDQDRCVDLFEGLGDAELLQYAQGHRDVIKDFGRFPHRNSVLGRETSTPEQEFLDAGGFAG